MCAQLLQERAQPVRIGQGWDRGRPAAQDGAAITRGRHDDGDVRPGQGPELDDQIRDRLAEPHDPDVLPLGEDRYEGVQEAERLAPQESRRAFLGMDLRQRCPQPLLGQVRSLGRRPPPQPLPAGGVQLYALHVHLVTEARETRLRSPPPNSCRGCRA